MMSDPFNRIACLTELNPQEDNDMGTDQLIMS